MLHTTGKENLSLFVLLVLFIIDNDTLQAIGNSKISFAGSILYFLCETSTWHLHCVKFLKLIEWFVCVNGLRFITGGFRVFVNISIVFLIFQDTKFSEV